MVSMGLGRRFQSVVWLSDTRVSLVQRLADFIRRGSLTAPLPRIRSSNPQLATECP